MHRTPLKTLVPMTLFLLVFVSGCTSTKVVYVKDGDPVRLAEPVKAKVWVPDANGDQVKSDKDVEIPEGWYALPDPR